jgi:glycosyltransferase involved in cell wall biosynthesis
MIIRGIVTVSVIIPTYNRTRLLIERALPSVLNQTYTDLDIHVVGDGTEDETVEAMAAIDDPRVRFTNLPHSIYPDDPEQRWCAIGVPPINYGLSTALGEWVTVLADDDAYPLNRTEIMLAAAQDVDCVYGRTEVIGYGIYGEPGKFTDGAYLLRASLGYRYDEESWKRGTIADLDLRARLFNDVKTCYIPDIVYYYWPFNKNPLG